MIMYTWKQFGNDFRNGDDAVFWDSNRPRDDNGTKIRPWLQGDKWSFRDVNKKTGFSQIDLKWYSNCSSSTSWKPLVWEVPTIKKKRTRQDRTDVWYPSVFWKEESYKVWAYDNEFHNEPQYMLVEWNFSYYSSDGNNTVFKNKETTCLEIINDWLYYIDCVSQFMFSYDNTDNYNSNNAYQYKEWSGIMQYDKKLGYFIPTQNRCQRAVWNWDSLSCALIIFLTRWSRILPCGAFQQPIGQSGIYFLLTATLLW